MKISDLVHEAHALAEAKGWWPYLGPSNPIVVASKLALIHSEVSEALEEVRDGFITDHRSEEGKPCGLPSELADIVIRVADLAGALGIDLEAAIETKMAYNATRKHRHGGRLL